MSLQIFLYLETTAKVRRSGLKNSYILQPPVKPNSYPSCHYSVSYYNRTCGSKSELNAADYKTKSKMPAPILSCRCSTFMIWSNMFPPQGAGLWDPDCLCLHWMARAKWHCPGHSCSFIFFSPCMLVSPQCPPSCRNKDRLCCSWHFSL